LIAKRQIQSEGGMKIRQKSAEGIVGLTTEPKARMITQGEELEFR